MDTHCVGFPPSIDADCRILVLGSMPSVKSLAAQQYYAHPQNRFWPLMALLLTGAAEPPADYGERLRLLLSHHIALWDAIASCERVGDGVLEVVRNGNELHDTPLVETGLTGRCTQVCASLRPVSRVCRANLLWASQALNGCSL